MTKTTGENVTLGFFVAAGVVLLVVSLYVIGKNQSMFGSTFHLRAQFRNVNGLMAGNNIRFSGIQAGTVNKITVIADTTIEVDLLIEDEMKKFIKKNSLVSIGNEGLMGNKVINITPSGYPGQEVQSGDMLTTESAVGTDKIMSSLSATGNNIEELSGSLIRTVQRINESKLLWQILDDTTLSAGLRSTVSNLRMATVNINKLSAELSGIVSETKAGKGVAGAVLTDERMATDLKQAISNLNAASGETMEVLKKLDSVVAVTHSGISEGKGLVHAALEDPEMVSKVKSSLDHIEKGTASFELTMEALKHNFLTRGYIRKQEKKKQQAR
jgi:phospholipid/cholesterol/gamma-HCH transport system substrate-binding protein